MVDYTISYYSDVVQTEILGLPDTLAARYIVLTRRMVVIGLLYAGRETNRHAAWLYQEVGQDASSRA